MIFFTIFSVGIFSCVTFMIQWLLSRNGGRGYYILSFGLLWSFLVYFAGEIKRIFMVTIVLEIIEEF